MLGTPLISVDILEGDINPDPCVKNSFRHSKVTLLFGPRKLAPPGVVVRGNGLERVCSMMMRQYSGSFKSFALILLRTCSDFCLVVAGDCFTRGE